MAQPFQARRFGIYRENVARPLRYRPENGGFVVTGGTESFNRPLYCNNTAMRVDGGDRCEWSLYLPGRGGVVRVGVVTPGGAVWLRDLPDAATMRYVDGRIEHEIKVAGQTVKVTSVAAAGQQGLILRIEADGDVEIVLGYGGMGGERHSRNGDIGTDRLPMSEYFRLRPEHCRGNAFEASADGFEVRGRGGTLRGVWPRAQTGVRDGVKWDALAELLGSAGGETPVVVGQLQVSPGRPALAALFSNGWPATRDPAGTGWFAAAPRRHNGGR